MKKSKITALLLSLVMSFYAFGEMLSVSIVRANEDTVKITVNYVYEGNMSMVSQPYTAQLEKGSDFTKNIAIPVKSNYTVPVDRTEGLREGIELSGSILSFDLKNVTSDVTVNLFYVAGKADYTVNHYKQNLEDDDYTLFKTVVLTGDIDSYTKAVKEVYKGFVCKGVPEYIIASDGTTQVNIYYDRSYYTVVFDASPGINGPSPVYGKYGSEFSLDTVPIRHGYTFMGWNPQITGIIDHDITYKALWKENTERTDYTIVLWGQNANDDEYSYLSSHDAYGAVGTVAEWKPDSYICEAEHIHTEDCYILSCEKEEHIHNSSCGLDCKHTHSVECLGLSEASPDSTRREYMEKYAGLTSGYVYEFNGSSRDYYVYYNGKWYKGNSDMCGTEVYDSGSHLTWHIWKYEMKAQYLQDNCNHTHGDECYKCGVPEHKHSDLSGSCYTLTCTKASHTHTASCLKMDGLHPDKSLWVYKTSEPVEIKNDGTTVLNVYFDRTQFTLTFNRKTNTLSTVTDRWGANISREYIAVRDSSGYTQWSASQNGGSYKNYFEIMPKENQTWYGSSPDGSGTTTFTYYGQVLPGEKGTVTKNGVGYDPIIVCSFNGSGYYVSSEDFYTFEGFTLQPSISTEKGESMKGATFFYSRNKYDLTFFSASNTSSDRNSSVYYEQNLAPFDYVPSNVPDTVEPDAVFTGWYKSPERSGSEFELSSHNMPASNMALYAKWVNGLYTVETYTDNSFTELYTYDGYSGVQTDIVKYERAEAPVSPVKEGKAFSGWFYIRDGKEQPFSFTMPVTGNYRLYPKFSDVVTVTYKVHYYLEGTTQKLSEDKVGTEQIGSTVTEKARLGNELTLADDPMRYFPDKTGTSIVLLSADEEITFYYKKASGIGYTVRYLSANGNSLLSDEKLTTDYSVVTVKYKPIDGYTPRSYSVTSDISSDGNTVIVFVYDKNTVSLTVTKEVTGSPDSGQKFVFTLKGTDSDTEKINMTFSLKAGEPLRIDGLPTGEYLLSETKWSYDYTPENSEYEKAITLSSPDSAVFVNVKNNSAFLRSEALNENIFSH